MIVNGQRFSPPPTPTRNPLRTTMAGAPEPADPIARKEDGLPPKSYAAAVEKGIHTNNGGTHDVDEEDAPIDETAIKESPPPTRSGRDGSEPRPLGEVMDEHEAGMGSPGSPTLRHPKGRLEETARREMWRGDGGLAQINGGGVKENGGDGKEEGKGVEKSGKNVKEGWWAVNGTGQGEGVGEKSEGADEGLETVKETKEESNGDVADTDDKTLPQDTNGDSRNSMVNGIKNALDHASGDQNPPSTFAGVGSDSTPRSPTVRKGHKRGSSKSLNGTFTSQEQGKDIPTGKEEEEPTLLPSSTQLLSIHDPVHGANGNTPATIYENLTNKSGENLASLKPDSGYYLSLEQRANKAASAEPPPALDGRTRTRSDSAPLTSGRRAGAGWSRSAIRWAPFHIPLQRRLQTLLVLLHTLSIAGLLALFFLLCTIPLLWPILLPYTIYVLTSSAATSGTLSHRSEWLRNSKIWSLFASYFPARLHRSQPLEAGRKYIFGYHPHGIISHGAFAAFATEALGFSQLFPGITNTLLTLDSNFRIPLYRDYALRMGLASVSRESCENILSRGGPNGEGMGRAITIVVGGARESLDAKPGYLRLVLKRRKGFVKLAIRAGADLVPVLAFGENDIYDQLDTAKHPHVHKVQMGVKKFMGFTVPLFHARGIFNYDVGLMPYRRPINIVVGRPVQILQSKSPDPAYVDEIHEKYVNELLRIWEEWKDVFARDRKGELEMVE